MIVTRRMQSLCLMVTLSLVACGADTPSTGGRGGATRPATQPAVVRLVPVVTRPVPRGVEATGTLAPNEVITLSAKVNGRIIAYDLDVGDRVWPGRALAQIDPTDYALQATRSELAVAETLAKLGLTEFPARDFAPDLVPTVRRAAQQAANAKVRLERIRQLHQQTPPLVSDQEFADVETAYHVATSDLEVARLNARSLLAEAQTRRAELEVARQRLADTKVAGPPAKSPTTRPDGAPITRVGMGVTDSLFVAERFIARGDYVREGSPLFRLVDDDPIKLRLPVPERYAGQVMIGQRVSMTVQAHVEAFVGTVARISPEIDPSSRTFMIEAHFANRDHRLKPGAFAKATIVTRPDASAVFAPRRAIVSFAGVHRVFTVVDGKARAIRVELGPSEGGLVEVTRGLAGSERVIDAPPSRLVDGAPVTDSGPATRAAQTRAEPLP